MILGLQPVGAGFASNMKEMNTLVRGFELELSSSGSFGRYSGDVRIALGEVVDEGYSETPRFLGIGPNSAYLVVLASSREGTVREAITHLFRDTGLLAASLEEADFIADVTILRNRFSYDGDRIRSEVFLKVAFRRAEEIVGRVLVCGNAESYYRQNSFGFKKARPTYWSAFNDALYKLVDSSTFLELVGEDWTAGARPVEVENKEITRISRAAFYGPPERPPVIEELEPILGSKVYDRLLFQDFELLDREFTKEAEKAQKEADKQVQKRKKKGKGDGYQGPTSLAATTTVKGAAMMGVSPIDLACIPVPELLREHLQAFYPGAFPTVERRKQWEAADGLVVTGEVHRFNMGKINTKLIADIYLKDGLSGETLHSMEVKLGGGVTWASGLMMGFTAGAVGASGGQFIPLYAGVAPAMRDMQDDIARSLAYVLIETLRPGYRYPEDLEVAFDGVVYPLIE
jgi:hypothetical protein